ncbi:MAG: hypothetical protein Q9208_006767 [Pyrenodesmia sp. 3 TL-2023]
MAGAAPDAKPSGASRLEINLQPPPQERQSYLPGDVLEGEIVLYNPYHPAGFEASVTFSGASKVRFGERGRLFYPAHTYEGEFVSVNRTHLARTTRRDAVLWKFRVPIPTSMLESSASFADDESFANFPGSSLPPSFDAQGQGNGFRQLEKRNVGPHGKIVYTLVATLAKPFGTQRRVGLRTCQMQLPLSSLRSLGAEAPALQTISFHYHDLMLDNLDDWAITGVLQNVHCGLARSPKGVHCCKWSTPSITIKTSIPSTFMAEQPLEIALYFRRATVKYAREKLSPLVLHALNVEITSHIQARAPSALRSALRRGPQAKGKTRSAFYSMDAARLPTSQRFYQLVHEEGIEYLSARGNPLKTRFEPHIGYHRDMEYQWDIGALVPNPNTTSLHTPTIKTSNLSLSYTVHLRAEFSLCGEKIPFDITRPLDVAPRFSKEDVLPPKNRIGISRAEGEKENEGDAPPAYSEHQSTSRSPTLPGEPTRLPSYQIALDEKL